MPKKQSKYFLVLKEFTKINNKLPQDRKVSIKDRRRLVKEVLLPQYENVSASRIRKRELKQNINNVIESLPPRELCDLNYIDVGQQYGYVEWFAIDETISELVPDCIYCKVSAGEFGETRIFNTRNYEYARTGCRNIVENIRPEAENMSGSYIFSGYQKLRPRKRNDGTPENYYLDFVLFRVESGGQSTAYGETETVKYEVPKNKEVRKKKTKIKNIIESKVKKLKQERVSKRRSKKRLDANIKEFSKKIKQTKKSNTKQSRDLATKLYLKAVESLEKYRAEGKISESQYKAALEKIFKDFTDEK